MFLWLNNNVVFLYFVSMEAIAKWQWNKNNRQEKKINQLQNLINLVELI